MYVYTRLSESRIIPNQRLMRVWHSVGRAREVALTEESMAADSQFMGKQTSLRSFHTMPQSHLEHYQNSHATPRWQG